MARPKFELDWPIVKSLWHTRHDYSAVLWALAGIRAVINQIGEDRAGMNEVCYRGIGACVEEAVRPKPPRNRYRLALRSAPIASYWLARITKRSSVFDSFGRELFCRADSLDAAIHRGQD